MMALIPCYRSEEEEQYEEMQAEPQVEVIEIDAEDAPYLNLRDDRE